MGRVVTVLSILIGLSALAWLASAALNERLLTITVVPRVVMVGGSIRVTCRVVRNPDNRWLDLGVEDYRASGDQLAGDDALVEHRLDVLHVPCTASVAFCRLIAQKPLVVTQTFEVAGCH